LKVAIVHQFFDLLGGAERATFQLVEALKKTHHKTNLFTTTETDLSESSNFRITKLNSSIPYLWKLKKMVENKKIYSQVIDHDLIIVMDGGFAFRYLPRKKIILYCHSTFEYEKKFVNEKIPGWRGFLWKIVQRDLKKNLAELGKENVFLITNSKYTRNKINELFQKNSKVIYPPVDINSFTKPNLKKTKKIVTISRYAPEKNLDFVINAIKQGKFDFDLIGNSKLKQIELYHRLKSETSGISKIKLHNNISEKQIKQILFSSNVYFHGAVETFGISVIEAIAAGCIPIIPDNSAHKETVPFSDLRYQENDLEDAKQKLSNALTGEYDHYLPQLKQHINQFGIKQFQEKMISFIESFS